MRFKRRIVVLCLTLFMGSPGTALAYPQDPNGCNDSTITWYFNTTDWYGRSTARGWARAAIDLWEQPLDYDGTRLMSMNGLVWGQTGGSGDVEMVLADDWAPSKLGWAECTGSPSIRLNQTYLADPDFVWQLARHEMGHLAGFEHSGADESWNGDDPPSMATCIEISEFPSTNRLSQDDVAYANWSHSDVSSIRPMQANFGFEQGFSYWGVAGGTVEEQSSGGATGPGHIRYKTSQSSHYVYQTINLATGDDDESYRAAINYRQQTASGYGLVTGVLFRKRIDYPNDNSCAYEDGLQNLNYWQYEQGTSWIAMTETPTVDPGGTTSWTYAGSPSLFNPTDSQGYVFQYRVYSYSTDYNGVPQWVHLDNLRSEGT